MFLKGLVELLSEKGACMAQPWFMYDIVIQFGDPNCDIEYGGAHDLDIGAPPNYPVTALLPGHIASITDGKNADGTAIWGRQVGVLLDQPYNGNPYLAYLHLSEVEPTLKVGDPVSKGDLIGWVGGASDPAQYAGTSNPTGHNFLNTPGESSRIQVGVALMRGEEYGHEGWTEYPDPASNPTQIILDARREGSSIDLTNSSVANYFSDQGNDVWKCSKTGFVVGHGILNFYRNFGGDALCGLTYLGLPLSNEIPIAGHPGVVKQEFERGIVCWDPNHEVDSPPGAGQVYLMHLPN